MPSILDGIKQIAVNQILQKPHSAVFVWVILLRCDKIMLLIEHSSDMNNNKIQVCVFFLFSLMQLIKVARLLPHPLICSCHSLVKVHIKEPKRSANMMAVFFFNFITFHIDCKFNGNKCRTTKPFFGVSAEGQNRGFRQTQIV